jgi:hypothetical protein
MKDIYVIDTETGETCLLDGIDDSYEIEPGIRARCGILYSKGYGYTYQRWHKLKFSHAGSTINRFAEQFWWFMIGVATASTVIGFYLK